MEEIVNLLMYVYIALAVVGGIYKMFYEGIFDSFEIRDPLLDEIVVELTPLNPDIISKLSFFKGTKSYTIDKSRIYICMKTSTGEYYPKNFLKYVVLHEISHVLSPEVGHTDLFYKIFTEQLNKAHDMGLYDKTQPMVENYCGYK